MKTEELRLLLASATQDSKFSGLCYFVGGCVRDQLLKRSAHVLDADIAVELPGGGIALARFMADKLGIPAPQVHPRYGTAKLALNDIELEFAMTRGESYLPGNRFPQVKFVPLAEDCRRRDFTVNALYQRIADAQIFDPGSWGLKDIENRLIRCIREPRDSFQEDPLRLLRALRFAATLDFEIEALTLEAMTEFAPLVVSLSRSRCHREHSRLHAIATPRQLTRWNQLARATGIRDYYREKLALAYGNASIRDS